MNVQYVIVIMIFRNLALFLFRYGFITFETQEDAQKILQEVSNIPCYDSLLNNLFHSGHKVSLVFWPCSAGLHGLVGLLRLVILSSYNVAEKIFREAEIQDTSLWGQAEGAGLT